MIKIEHNLRLFNKLYRKYWKKHANFRKINGRRVFCGWKGNWWNWEWININLDKNDVIKYFNKLRDEISDVTILTDFIGMYGKEVYINSNPEYKGVLVALQKTNEDHYWVIKNNDGKYYYESCVGGVTQIENKELLNK